MVKTETLLVVGGVGLAAAFAFGLFGSPAETETPLLPSIPDFSFLGDLFSGGIGVPDLGSSFFEGIAQQLQSLQDQVGATGSTIVNLPAEFFEGVNVGLDETFTIFDESVSSIFDEGLFSLPDDFFSLGQSASEIPVDFVGGFFEGLGDLIPEFNLSAGLLSGVIGAAAGLPLGPGAIITGLGSFVAGGFGAVPLSEQIKITPLPKLGLGLQDTRDKIGAIINTAPVSVPIISTSGSRTAPPRSPSAKISGIQEKLPVLAISEPKDFDVSLAKSIFATRFSR